jgi:hypothetical protein
MRIEAGAIDDVRLVTPVCRGDALGSLDRKPIRVATTDYPTSPRLSRDVS